MKYIVLFISIIFINIVLKAQCNNVAIDLNTWSAQGGNWVVNPGGTSVNQTVNGADFYFLSPQPFINVTITGTLSTSGADDDAMGFVFGVEGTIGSGTFHYYRFSWDQGGFTGGGLFVEEVDQTGVVATHLALPGNFWTRNNNHNFSLTYKSSNVSISVDGTELLNLDGCFSPGQFGFYNLSQADVTYSNFQYVPISDYLFTSNDTICVTEQASTDIFCLNNNLNPYSVLRWDFGDGTVIHNATSAQHTYASGGNYNIKLYVMDFLGCEDSVFKPITVYDPSFTLGADQSICPGTSATFSSSNTTAGNTYSWSTGETTSNITKNTTGQYILTLTDLYGCIDKDTVNLLVGLLPTVDFSAASVCLYDNVSFTNNTLGAQSLLWDFGDGTTSSLTNPSHQYTATGNYSIKLIATFGSGCKDSITKSVDVFEVPNTDFTSMDDCFNNNAIFNNQSTINNGTIDYIWDFGDATANGVSEDESHLYSNPGTYNVRLISVSNNLCYDTVSKSFERHSIPNVDYSLTDECLYDSVLFTNNSSVATPSTIVNYEWLFGDGETNNSITTYHKYNAAGTFNTKLIATTQFGCKDSLEKQVIIHDVPNTDFSFSNDCYNKAASFTDQSNITNGNITEWDWSFGDGTSGTLNNETHQYSLDGDYQVQLITTSNMVCKDTVKYTITRYPVPTPSYTANSECVYNEVQFNDNSVINTPSFITEWDWTVGQGTTFTNQNPSILFPTAGNQPIKLVVTSNHGCKDSIENSLEIYSKPNAAMITSDACNNFAATFVDNSSVINDLITNWQWDIGDGTISNAQNFSHQYDTPDTYAIQLIVTTNNQCKDTVSQDITRFPIPTSNFSFTNECLYNDLVFENQSIVNNGNTIDSYVWNFGDGSPIDQNENTTHQYSTPGIYQATLTITSNNNCIKDTSMLVEAYAVPLVNFVSDDKCINEGALQFNNLSSIQSGSFDTWKWNFGNGITSQLLHPNYQYTLDGTYDVTLIGISNNNCSDTITNPVNIYNKPIANFDSDIQNNCLPFCSSFTDLSSDPNGIVVWEWSFENNPKSFLQSPTLCLEIEGEYDVSLIVTNQYSCKDTLIKTNYINAWPNPIANFNLSEEVIDVINPFITLTNTSFDAEEWTWNLGNGVIDSINYNTEEVYDNQGEYSIDLLVENEYGCKDSISKDLLVLSKAFHYVPNSFSPNGDGINDVFNIEHEAFNFVSVGIYDRWGKQVFFTEDVEQHWDGTYNGSEFKTTTFAWVLTFLDEKGNKVVEKGSVTLIK